MTYVRLDIQPPRSIFHGDSNHRQEAPVAEAGLLLRQLQGGEKLSMPHSRPMPTIGRRCHELRIPDEDKTWRIVYRIDDDAIVILEVFPKKDRTTPQYVIDICKKRIKDYDAV